MITKVKPSDLQPGDLVERINQDLDFVYVAIRQVKKVKTNNGVPNSSVAYRIYLEPGDVRPDQMSYPEHTHLRAFVVRPSQRVNVKR